MQLSNDRNNISACIKSFIFTSGTIGATGSTNGTIGAFGSTSGTIGAIDCRNCSVFYGRIWSPMVPMATNGTNGKIISGLTEEEKIEEHSKNGYFF